MGLIIRQSLKSSVGYYIGVVLGAINTLFVSTRFLTPDQLGVSRILLENSLIFAAFAHLGTPYISDRFFAHFQDNAKKHNGFLVFLLTFPLIGFTLFSILFLLFNQYIENYFIANSPSVVPFLWLTLPMTFCWLYILVLEAYCRANGRTAIPTFLREAVFRTINIMLIIMVGLRWISFDLFLILFVVAMFVIVAILLFYVYHLGKLYLKWDASLWTKTLIYQMVVFGLIIIVGGLGVNLILFIDRNVLANQIGTTSVAIFMVASYIATVIEIPSKSIRQISGPIIASAILRKDDSKIKELYVKSSSNLFLLGGIMLILITCNIDNLFSLLPKSEIYAQGKWVVVIIGIAKWIDMSLGLNNEVIGYSKYYKFNTYFIILLAIAAIALNYLLIPKFGVLGAAIATGVITVFASCIRLLFVNYTFKLMPFGSSFTKSSLILTACLMIGLIFPDLGSTLLLRVLTIVIKSGLVSFLFIFLLLRLRVSEDIQAIYTTAVTFVQDLKK
jgi:O-antigen/teichoic acid export membrane protein